MNFRDSPDSLNGLGIPGNIWFQRFAVTYMHQYQKKKVFILPFTAEYCASAAINDYFHITIR